MLLKIWLRLCEISSYFKMKVKLLAVFQRKENSSQLLFPYFMLVFICCCNWTAHIWSKQWLPFQIQFSMMTVLVRFPFLDGMHHQTLGSHRKNTPCAVKGVLERYMRKCQLKLIERIGVKSRRCPEKASLYPSR